MVLKGVNLGSWLLMEGYILGGRNIAESIFKKQFTKVNGKSALREFEHIFRENFITEEDFSNIAQMGANCVRLPFNYRLIKSTNGISYLNKALSLADKYKLGVILDLHAAAGAQNCDWHSDSDGRAFFWENEKFRSQTMSLWENIIEECKDATALIGYDIINEPVLGNKPTDILTKFYKEAVRRIKAIDKKHTIFLEGDLWAQRIEFLKDLLEDNVSVSIHTYQPLNYTFNFAPFYQFPGGIDNELWDKERMRKYLEPYFLFSKNNKTPIFVGEFGINWRGGFFGELNWLNAILEVFEEFNFGFTYWTYKAVAGGIFPDGLYQYIANNRYIMRQGPVLGWENYIACWKKEKNEIAQFLQTKNCMPNNQIISSLKKFFIR